MEKLVTDKSDKISFFNKELVIIFLVFKVLISSLFILFFYTNAEYHITNNWNRWYSKEIIDAIYLPFANWDGQHYLFLAENGYNIRADSNAFYPLYPMLIRGINLVFNNVYLAAFILNTALSYSFCYFFYAFSRHYLQKKESLLVLAFALCFPTAFYLTAFYTEALFLALFFGFLYYYSIKKSNYSLIFIFLMPLCKGQAFFVFGGILLYLFIKYLKNHKINWKKQYYVFAAFLGGALSYFLFFYFVTGNIFAGIDAQKYFYAKNSISNILNPFHFIEYLFSSINTPEKSNSDFNILIGYYINTLIDRLFIITGLLGLFFVCKTKNALWIVFYFVLFYPVASMGNGMSFSRFSFLFFPILALALWKTYPNQKNILYGISLSFLCLQIYFIYRFSLNLWVA